MKSRKKILIAAASALAVILVLLFFPGGEDSEQKTYHPVQRGDLTIAVIEGGSLEAVEEELIRNELDGVSRIIFLIPEGSYVIKGDLLVEFDSGNAEENLQSKQESFESRQAALITANNDLVIAESTIASEIRKAELKVDFAEMDLTKFLELEKGQLVRDAEIAIDTQQEELTLAREKYQFSEKLAAKKFETQNQVDRDRLDVSRAEKKLEVAQGEQEMLNDFDLRKQYVQNQSTLTEAKAELERVKKQGQSKLAQNQAEVSSAESTLRLTEKALEKMKEQLVATKIFAKKEGLVTYAKSRSYYNQDAIEEGAEIRNRQEIIKIPNLTRMKAVVSVHESMISQVKKGQKAFVVLDALPDRQFSGVVTKVAILPESINRRNPDLKVYTVEVLLNEKLEGIKPGVSARAEIIVDQLRQVLFVPIQAVTTIQDQQVCFLEGADEPRPVETGLFNTQFIEIRSGLNSGDQVLLNPPLARKQVTGEEAEIPDEEESQTPEKAERSQKIERTSKSANSERSKSRN